MLQPRWQGVAAAEVHDGIRSNSQGCFDSFCIMQEKVAGPSERETQAQVARDSRLVCTVWLLAQSMGAFSNQTAFLLTGDWKGAEVPNWGLVILERLCLQPSKLVPMKKRSYCLSMASCKQHHAALTALRVTCRQHWSSALLVQPAKLQD